MEDVKKTENTEAVSDKSSELREFLANIQLWRGLPEDQLDALAKIAIAKTYRKGEVIFEEGDEGRGFFVVKSAESKFSSSRLTAKNRYYTFSETESILPRCQRLMVNAFPPLLLLLRKASCCSSRELLF
jgi:hypothetical protein